MKEQTYMYAYKYGIKMPFGRTYFSDVQVRILNEYETSKDSCLVGRKKNFGIIDNSIWVNYGCRAKFLICYEKGMYIQLRIYEKKLTTVFIVDVF